MYIGSGKIPLGSEIFLGVMDKGLYGYQKDHMI